MLGDLASDDDGYDVIGDVHGCGQQLLGLLQGLGYSDASGAFRHPTRTAVFVGDLIDRGPEQVQVLRTVRAMVEAGSARVVMGNHEFNAIAYATEDRNKADRYLRPHNEKNTEQHSEFLSQIGAGSSDHKETIDWFATLPLWLDLGGLRVVHACWDPAAMDGLGSPHVDDQVMIDASNEDHDSYRWVEHLCKGPEVKLPGGFSFDDKDGENRTKARYRWWDPDARTYREACLVIGDIDLPDVPIEHPPVEPYRDDVPVLFGHYWRNWSEIEITSTAACVDYSAVRGGPLVAYRWSGETDLSRERLFHTELNHHASATSGQEVGLV